GEAVCSGQDERGGVGLDEFPRRGVFADVAVEGDVAVAEVAVGRLDGDVALEGDGAADGAVAAGTSAGEECAAGDGSVAHFDRANDVGGAGGAGAPQLQHRPVAVDDLAATADRHHRRGLHTERAGVDDD